MALRYRGGLCNRFSGQSAPGAKGPHACAKGQQKVVAAVIIAQGCAG